MAGTRARSPIGVVLVAALLAGLVTALVLSFVLDGDERDVQPSLLTLPGDGTVPHVDLSGQAAPNFQYEPLDGGDDIDFEEFRAGRPAVLNFFADWCPPCVREMPDLEAAHQDVGDQVAFLGLSYNETAQAARTLVELTGVTYETGRDPAGDILAQYSGVAMPTTVFIDADGIVTTTHTGAISPGELQDELDALLGVIDAPLALAFTAGMVATVNPCGFAMLPAYLSFFLGLEAGVADEDRRAGVARALAVGAAVTLGFVAVFTTIGAVISHLSLALEEWFPWMTMVVGVGVFALGVALVLGFDLSLALPKLERGGRDRALPSMFVFGVSYAVASLSCTLPVFLTVVAGTFSRSNLTSGIAMYVFFALGMGLVLTVLTLTLALARQSLVHRLRSSLPVINRIAGVFLIVAGAYFTWYGIYELRIRDDPRATAGPVATVTGWSSDISNWIQDLGPERLGLILGIVICVALLYVLLRPADDDGARGAG